MGMPRSIYTYEPDRGWNTLNFIISVGGMIQAIAVLIFVWNLVDSYLHGQVGRQRSRGMRGRWSGPRPRRRRRTTSRPIRWCAAAGRSGI